MISKKSRLIAMVLCLPPLGWLGLHRFYVGRIITGILMMFTIGGFGIYTMSDLFELIMGNFKDKNGHNLLLWFGKKWSLSYFVVWAIILFLITAVCFKDYFYYLLLSY